MQSEIMNSIPVLMKGILLQDIDSGEVGKEMVVVLPNKNQIKVVNEVGAFVLNLVDGKRKVAEIVREVQRVYAAPPEQIQSDVLTFIQQLAAKEIITFSFDQV